MDILTILICLIVIQNILAVPKFLREKGLYFFGLGFAIRINIKQTPKVEKEKLDTIEELVVLYSMLVVVLVTIYLVLLFAFDIRSIRLPLIEDLFTIIENIFNKETGYIDIYLAFWFVALFMMIPHAYAHVVFGRRIGVRYKAIYLITLLGLPLLTHEEPNYEDIQELTPKQKMFLHSAGIIANTSIFTIIYLLSIPLNYTWLRLAAYIALILLILNSAIITPYINDGSNIFTTFAESKGGHIETAFAIISFLLLMYYFIALSLTLTRSIAPW